MMNKLPLWIRVALVIIVTLVFNKLMMLFAHADYALATLVLVNNGEGRLLNNFFNKVAPQDWTMCLFKSNTTPAETDTTATYTEADFTGYAAKALANTAWTVTEGAPSHADAAAQTFTSSADQTLQNVYGYFFKQTTSGILGWVERFTGAPYAIQNNGDNIQITPTFTAD